VGGGKIGVVEGKGGEWGEITWVVGHVMGRGWECGRGACGSWMGEGEGGVEGIGEGEEGWCGKGEVEGNSGRV